MDPRVATAVLIAALAVPAGAAAQVGSIPAPAPTATATPMPTPSPMPTPAPEVMPEARRRLPDGRTLLSALRRAWLAGHLDRASFERHRATVLRARRVLRRARGTGATELGSVLAGAGRLAASGRLTASRLEAVLLTVRRNTGLVAGPGLPAPGARLHFPGDPLVFQRFTGHGVQIHPLATAGRANALARPCLRHRRWLDAVAARFALMRLQRGTRPRPVPRERGAGCRPHRLERVLDRLAAVASARDGGVAWEYLFPFGGAEAPWISGMAQATAAQALARGAVALRDERLEGLAEAALHAFERPPPYGVRVAAPGGVRYALYSSHAGLDVLNGQLQAVIGLHEVARLLGSDRAATLWRDAEAAARASLGAFDTGAWSLYSRSGRESTLGYHRLVRRFLERLCRRTGRAPYCDAAQRFRRYERTPPRVSVAVAGRPRAASAAGFAVTLDKGSRVTVRAGSRRVFDGWLERGAHRLRWVPARRGQATLTASATGPEGLSSSARDTVRVRRSERALASLQARRRARELRRREAARRRARENRLERRAERRAAARGGRR